MHPHTRLFSFLVISCLLFAPLLRAQDNPLNDPDLKEMLKEAQEMQKEAKELQKQSPTSQDTKKKLADMLSQAKEEEARQEEQEKREKEKLQAALKKQLEAPGPIVCPIGRRPPQNSRPLERRREKSWMTKSESFRPAPHRLHQRK